MTEPCWDNLYFHNSLAFSFYFGSDGFGVKKEMWEWVRGLRIFIFLELVNIFVLHGKSHCWSKLNAEFILFHFFPNSQPFFFVVVETPEQFTHLSLVRVCG